MMHEASLSDQNCFLTLTYGDVAAPHSLRYRDFQDFMRRLRREFRSIKIRFFACGEYGDQLGRPHFHACIFGWRPLDLEPIKKDLYRSATLERLWPHGFSSVGELTFESAAYVARYVCKKVTGDLARFHYEFICPDTGEITARVPEFAHMSRRPGIGFGWLQRFRGDSYNSEALGTVIVRGRECKTPRYYDRVMRKELIMDDVEYSRHQNAVKRAGDNTPERLLVREKVAKARLSQTPRKI